MPLPSEQTFNPLQQRTLGSTASTTQLAREHQS
jgi:hypothetical protein